MGKFNSIADGKISGKVGNLVFYQVDGRPRVRSTGRVSKPPSPAQERAREQLKVVISFLKPLLAVVRLGFARKARHKPGSAYNMAVSYLKKQAVTGEGEETGMAYDRVMLSQGRLSTPEVPSVVRVGDKLQFSWRCPEWMEWPRSTDMAVMVAYFPEAKSAVYNLYGPMRSALGGLLPIPPEYAEERIEVYLFFVSQTRKEVSDSVYIAALSTTNHPDE